MKYKNFAVFLLLWLLWLLINEFEKIQNKYTDKFSLKENKEELQKKKVIENNLQKGVIRIVRALDNYNYINS